MLRKLLTLVLPAVSVMVLVGVLSAQSGTFGPGPAPDPVNPQASIWGGIGLWKVLSADTPPAKSWGTSGWMDRVSRNPGQMTITETGTSLFFSPTKRLELMVRVNVNERILSRRDDELSLGQATLFSDHYNACTGCPLLQGPVAMPGVAINQLRNPIYNLLTGRAGYNPLYPYVNRRLQSGVGDVVVGGSYNITSESRGDSVSFAIHPWISIPTHHTSSALFSTGDQTGTVLSGVDFLLSKRVGISGMYFNGGYEFLPTVKSAGVTLVGSQSDIPIRIGMNIPRTSKIQFIVEATGDFFLGQGTPNTSFGSPDPIDLTAGFRAFVKNWFALNAGYRRPVNEYGGDKNGFYFSITTTNYPVAAAPPMPTVTASCSIEPAHAMAGTAFRLMGSGNTTSTSMLTYSWSTMAGTLDNANTAEARLDSKGLKPGPYNATLRVTDPYPVFSDCTATFTIDEPPPANPPTATCSVSSARVNQGEPVTFTVAGQSRDNRPMTYSWSGAVRGTATSVRLDTTRLSGVQSATAVVTDDRGLKGNCSASTTVVVPEAKVTPVEAVLNTCSFTGKSNVTRPTRVNNECKAILDDAALRLQQQGDAQLVLLGNESPKEAEKAKKAAGKKKSPADLGAQRASNVKDYLVTDKGIAAGRIEVRSSTGGEPTVKLVLVPRGATYDGAGAAVTEPKPQPRSAKKPAAKKPAAPQ
jgi:hypothetical protein